MITVAFMSHIQHLADTGGKRRSAFWPKALLKCFMTFMTKLKCIFHLYIMTCVTAKKLGIVPVKDSSSVVTTFQFINNP